MSRDIRIIDAEQLTHMEDELARMTNRVLQAEHMNVRLVNTLRTIVDGKWRASEPHTCGGIHPDDLQFKDITDPRELAAAVLVFLNIAI